MNTFVMILTVMSAPVAVASNSPVTLQPESVITFEDTTERKVGTACERVRKALQTSGKVAFCVLQDGTIEAVTE